MNMLRAYFGSTRRVQHKVSYTVQDGTQVEAHYRGYEIHTAPQHCDGPCIAYTVVREIDGLEILAGVLDDAGVDSTARLVTTLTQCIDTFIETRGASESLLEHFEPTPNNVRKRGESRVSRQVIQCLQGRTAEDCHGEYTPGDVRNLAQAVYRGYQIVVQSEPYPGKIRVIAYHINSGVTLTNVPVWAEENAAHKWIDTVKHAIDVALLT